MSAKAVRAGSGIKPTQIAAGTDGSAILPRRFEFRSAGSLTSARPTIVWNRTGGGREIRVKVNASDVLDFGGSSDDGVGYFGRGRRAERERWFMTWQCY